MSRNRTQKPINEFYEDFGKKLTLLRIQNGLKQEDLAKLIGVSKPTIANYENGIRKVPLEVLTELSSILHADINYLLGLAMKTESETTEFKSRMIWDSELKEYDFTEEELIELIHYAKYLLYRREN